MEMVGGEKTNNNDSKIKIPFPGLSGDSNTVQEGINKLKNKSKKLLNMKHKKK